jgi:glycosyltransferase involved in cell wall biosynthesis
MRNTNVCKHIRGEYFVRILHIWDQAGVACTLAKYQTLLGHESKVLIVGAIDKYGIYEFYRKYCTKIDRLDFVKTCLSEAECADLIHVHSRSDIFLEVYRKFRTSKKIVLHYHGTDVRGFKGDDLKGMDLGRKIIVRSRRAITKLRNRCRLLKLGYFESVNTEAQRISRITLVSTPDLLGLVDKAIHLPAPIDTDHFKQYPSFNKQKKALIINTEVTNTELALKYCNSNNINLDIEVYDRTKKPIMFKEMPKLLNTYEVYVDIRYVNNIILENLSKTAIESLACGLKVLDYGLNIRRSVPQEHLPVNVTSLLSKLYSR